MPHFLILNGPNVNRLGSREPEVFGRQTLTDIETDLFQFAEALHIQLTFFQSNHEGDLIDAIHEAEEQYSGIVLNPGALSHYSYAIRDAVSSISLPVVEVHLSNLYARKNSGISRLSLLLRKGRLSVLELKATSLLFATY